MKKLITLFGALSVLGFAAPALADHDFRRGHGGRSSAQDCDDDHGRDARWRGDARRHHRFARWAPRNRMQQLRAPQVQYYWNGYAWVPYRR